MKRMILYFLSWMAMLAAFVAMLAAVLFIDSINHPQRLQAALVISGFVMLAGLIGVIITRHPEKHHYF